MKTTGAQVLGVLGVLGSLFWLSLNTVLSPDWGPPGSANYLGYQTVNRLWAPAFALILCGYVGLVQRYSLRAVRGGRIGFVFIVTGLLMMMAGNVAEFWFFSEQAYGAINGRNLAWIGVLLGLLAVLIGLLILGLAARRQGSLPQLSGLVFLLALPATVLVIPINVSLMGLPFVVSGAVAGALAAWPQSAAVSPTQEAT
jgi:hypothetical protein